MREIEAREMRTQAILNAEASTAKQATAAARSQSVQNASAQRIAELQSAFAKIDKATGASIISLCSLSPACSSRLCNAGSCLRCSCIFLQG